MVLLTLWVLMALAPAPLPGDRATKVASFYRPELDALRFFAFLMVFVCHTLNFQPEIYQDFGVPHFIAVALSNTFLSGAFGVYLFFTLSAFLITALLLREKDRFGTLHVKEFYIRRALRIWPLYFAALLAGAIYASIAGLPDLRIIPWFLLFAGNWIEILGYNPSFVIAVLWSVCVEEQFYLAWPPLVARLGKTGLRNAALAMLGAPIGGLPLGFALGLHGWRFGFSNSFSCISAMGVGILLALYPLRRVNRWLCFIFGSLSFPLAYALHLGDSFWPSVLSLLLVNAGSACLLLGVLNLRPSRVLTELGKVSYGLYVFHPIAIAVCLRVFSPKLHRMELYCVAYLVAFVATVALSFVSYRYLEAPFLRMKERFTFVRSRPV